MKIFGATRIDADSFPELYDKYVRKIFNFIYFKTHHKETAEDLTSQTFLKALKNLDQFDREKGLFSTWLYQIARNQVVDFYRSKKNEVNIDDVWDLAGNDDILRDLDTAQKLKKVQEYLKKLRPEQREIVLLRVWEGMSYKEIAEALGKDEAHCRVIFSRAIGALKSQMPLAVFLGLLLFPN
ncbi:MAG: sigma-70 family RNA polymerase sigma factor [Patescibacteria group bacterium]|nr:sigma-70 family RNA polymerase sigma factor [Patescibacteria group bacterium]